MDMGHGVVIARVGGDRWRWKTAQEIKGDGKN